MGDEVPVGFIDAPAMVKSTSHGSSDETVRVPAVAAQHSSTPKVESSDGR
jgi:hypothetical protein